MPSSFLRATAPLQYEYMLSFGRPMMQEETSETAIVAWSCRVVLIVVVAVAAVDFRGVDTDMKRISIPTNAPVARCLVFHFCGVRP